MITSIPLEPGRTATYSQISQELTGMGLKNETRTGLKNETQNALIYERLTHLE